MNILSAIQFKPDFAKSKAEVKNNIRKCEKLVYQAGQYGSSLIVFPELCMTGYSFLSHDEAWPVAENLSDPANSPTFSSMKKIAIDLKSYVVWGFIESKGNTLCNSAARVKRFSVGHHQRRQQKCGFCATPRERASGS